MHKIKCDFITDKASAKLTLNVVFDKISTSGYSSSYLYSKFIVTAFLEAMSVVSENNFSRMTFNLDLDEKTVSQCILPPSANFKSMLGFFSTDERKFFNIVFDITVSDEFDKHGEFRADFSYLIMYILCFENIKFNLDIILSAINTEKLKIYGYAEDVHSDNSVPCNLSFIDCNIGFAVIKYIDTVELFNSNMALLTSVPLQQTELTGVNEFTDETKTDNDKFLDYFVSGSVLNLKMLILGYIGDCIDKDYRFKDDLVYIVDQDIYKSKEIMQTVYNLDKGSSLLSISMDLGIAAPFYGQCELVYDNSSSACIPEQYIITDLAAILDIEYREFTDLSAKDLLTELSKSQDFVSMYKIKKVRHNLFKHFPVLRINKLTLDNLVENASIS